MEKDNKGRIIAIIALVVAVAGLSLGFAAFTTRLTINSVADVTAANNWSVGFSTNGSTLADVSTATPLQANENGNPGVVGVTKYTIGQSTNATLTTTEGSSVSYTLSIINRGKLTAYLDSVTFSSNPITCSNATPSSESIVDGNTTAGTVTTGGNSSTISPEDCAKMFGVTLTIDQTNYTSTSNSPTGSISPMTNGTPGSVPVTLTIAYKGDAYANAVADSLDGNIIVTVGTITVVYTSANS